MKGGIILALTLLLNTLSLNEVLIPLNFDVTPEDISIYPTYRNVIWYDRESNSIGIWNNELKTGFIDDKGNTIIPFSYETSTISHFSEGLANVIFNGKYGYINLKNEVVIPFQYDDAYSFENGNARVKLNGKYGLIDKLGNVVVPFCYDDISTGFNINSYYIKKDGKYGIMNKDGTVTVPTIYDDFFSDNDVCITDKYLVAKLEEKYGVIDYNGNVILPFEYELIMVGSDNCVSVKKDERFAVLSLSGDEIIPYGDKVYVPIRYGIFRKGSFYSSKNTSLYNEKGIQITKENEYMGITAYNNGSILAYDLSKSRHNTGLIDFDGNVISKFVYDDVSPLTNSIYKIRLGYRCGIWENGKEKYFNCDLTDILFLDENENVYAVDSNKEMIYIISPDGKIIKCFKGTDIALLNNSYVIKFSDGTYTIVAA